MAELSTGIASLTWSTVAGADGYNVQVIKNNLFHASEYVTGESNNSLLVSGLMGGDTVYANVVSFSGYNVSTSPSVSNSVTIFPENFHNTSGKGFEFEAFFLNGVGLDFIKTSSGYFGTGTYESENLFLKYSLINPRTNTSLQSLASEPFFSGSKYSLSGIADPTPPVFTESNNNLIGFSNTTPSRDFNLQLVATDYYQSGITGNISIQNYPIQTTVVDLTSQPSPSSLSGVLSIFPSYSIKGEGSEFFVSTNDYHPNGHTLFSGSSTDSIFSGLAPYSSGLFLKIVPSDFFGTGIHYLQSGIILLNETIQEYDSINTFSVLPFDDNTKARATFTVNEKSTSGYYATLSVDPTTGLSFGADSYLTGLLEQATGHVFSPLDLRTGTHENFYANLVLYESGSNIIRDSGQASFEIPYPKIAQTSVEYDYLSGQTSFNFTSNFGEVSNFRYFISGVGDPSGFYTGLGISSWSTGERVSVLNVQLQDSSDGTIFDQAYISGSGLLPIINAEFGVLSTSMDARVPINFQSANGAPITAISGFRRPVFKHLIDLTGYGLPTGLMSSGFDILNSGMGTFPDYLDFPVDGTYASEFGTLYEPAPSGAKPNETYSAYNESGAPFYYSSGSYYVYRFLPINGFGTGIPTDPIIWEYATNAISDAQTSYIFDSQDDIHNIANEDITFSGDKEFRGSTTVGDLHASGNVGIGTGVPGGALHVRGGADQNFVIKTGQSHLSIQAQTDDNLNNVDMGLGFGAKTVYLKSNGNVGIGRDDPSYKLDVYGDMRVDGDIGVGQYIYHDGDNNTYINFTDDDINITVGGVNMLDFTEGGTDEITFNESAQDLDVRIEGEVDSNLLFTDASTSKVGIGTSSPTCKLEVAGSISGASAVFGGLTPVLWTGAPTHFNSNGTPGQAAYDSNWLYICNSANNWVRIATDSDWP